MMVRWQSWLAAVACMCCLWAAELHAAHRQDDGFDDGLSAKMLAARQRRDNMLRNIKPSAKPKHVPEDHQQDLESIKKMMLDAQEFDAKMFRMASGKSSKSANRSLCSDPEAFCHNNKYRKTTLKMIRESPFIGLFDDLKGLTRFEGSSITYANGAYYAIFDSLRTIGKIGVGFQFRGAENVLIPEDAGEKESQFEGLQYIPSTGHFIAVRESIDHAEHGLVPFTEELAMNEHETEWSLVSACPVKFFGLEDENKGWEGLHYYEKDDTRFLIGLCESNYCKTIQGQDPPGLQRGNGRAILTRWEAADANDTDTCHWEVVKEIKLPEEAYFLDYAGIAFYPHPFGKRVAVVSQEDAAVWVGEFDWEEMEFVPGGQVYNFPRDNDCRRQYCNVEGLTFLDGQRLMFASDAAKKTQDFACFPHDQSVQIMALP